MLKERKVAERISIQACIYLTAGLEYLTAEILDTTINGMDEKKEKIIKPYNITVGLASDHETSTLFKDIEIRVFDPVLKVQRIDQIGRKQETVRNVQKERIKNI